MKIGIIITPERKREKIIEAFKEVRMEYEFINLLADDWETYFTREFDGYLIYPPSFPESWKHVFIKRLYLLENRIKDKVLPNLDSIIIYESKVSMHDFYKLNNLPHIVSHTFYNYELALNYAKKCELPVVVKEDSGSGAIGVKIIKKRRNLIRLVHKSFFLNNNVREYNSIKSIKNSFKNNLYPYKVFFESDKQYLPRDKNDSGFIHIQSFIKIKYEWRIIRIGDSFFGHKKLEDKKGYHSGSLNKEWGHVNVNLLNLVKKWSDELNLKSMCFDIFEDIDGNYYINELQVMFGTSTEEQLKIDGSPGRYLFKNNIWCFEEGDFSRNGCNNLRIEMLINIIKYNVLKNNL